MATDAELTSWNTAKLDELLQEFVDSVHEHLVEDQASGKEDIHSVVGYFMYRLLECKPGSNLPARTPPTITGPLFNQLTAAK